MKSVFTLALALMLGFTACSQPRSPKEKRTVTKAEQVAPAAGVTEFAGPGTISPDKSLPTVIDFNATWCGPCRMFKPVFEKVAKQYAGKVIFLSVDVDKYPNVAEQFNVSSIPQISVLYPDGLVKTTIGYMNEDQFLQLLSNWL